MPSVVAFYYQLATQFTFSLSFPCPLLSYVYVMLKGLSNITTQTCCPLMWSQATTMPLNYNFTFSCMDTRGATTKVGMDHVSPQCGIYTTRVFHACTHAWIFHTQFTLVDFPCNVHARTCTCIHGTAILCLYYQQQ